MDAAHAFSSDIAFTPSIKAVQARKGSRNARTAGGRSSSCSMIFWFVTEDNSGIQTCDEIIATLA